MRVSADRDRSFRGIAITRFGASRSPISGITIACFGDHDHRPIAPAVGAAGGIVIGPAWVPAAGEMPAVR